MREAEVHRQVRDRPQARKDVERAQDVEAKVRPEHGKRLQRSSKNEADPERDAFEPANPPMGENRIPLVETLAVEDPDVEEEHGQGSYPRGANLQGK